MGIKVPHFCSEYPNDQIESLFSFLLFVFHTFSPGVSTRWTVVGLVKTAIQHAGSQDALSGGKERDFKISQTEKNTSPESVSEHPSHLAKGNMISRCFPE